MSRRALAAALARLFRPDDASPDPGRARALERDLAARFDALHPSRRAGGPLPRRLALAGGLLLACGAASQAPAEFSTEVGKRVEIRTAAPLPPEVVRQAVRAVEGTGRELKVQVRVRPEADGRASTRIDLWGETLAAGDLEAALRRAAPALAEAEIRVSALQGTVRDALAGLVARRLLARDLPPDKLRGAIAAAIRAEEPEAEVKVEVEGDQDHRQVRVMVRKPAEGEGR